MISLCTEAIHTFSDLRVIWEIYSTYNNTLCNIFKYGYVAKYHINISTLYDLEHINGTLWPEHIEVHYDLEHIEVYSMTLSIL